MSYRVAREWFERALVAAELAGDRPEYRLIALRICELTEQADFDEARRLREPDLTTPDLCAASPPDAAPGDDAPAVRPSAPAAVTP